jgi:DHA1 family bicyclomycin/chloramphenicol resistance-like MFS transporter
VGRPLAVVLCLLTVFGPISMDLYLPVLPALTTELRATTSAAQLTVTACLLGLAIGQVVAGPVSDRFGRRRPLLIGVAAYVVTSVLCALSPTIPTLVAARFVQGLAGGVGIVISQAAGRDLYTGGQLVRYYGRLTVIAGLAAVVGPVLGGQLAAVTDWRGFFVLLAGVGALILLACVVILRETLPAVRRTTGGLVQTGRDFGRLLADRVLLGAVLISGMVSTALFAYIAGATFVLQDSYGLSPQGYSFAFGLNSLGFMLFGFGAARLCERWSEQGTLVVGLAMCLTGAGGLLATAVFHLPVLAVVLSLFTMVGGVARFGTGGLAAPLVGIAGSHDALPLGLVTLAATVLAVVSYLATIRGRATTSDVAPSPHLAAQDVGPAHVVHLER